MFSRVFRFTVVIGCLWLTSCSSDSAGTNAGVAAFKSIVARLGVVDSLLPDVATRRSSARSSALRAAFGVSWDDVDELSISNPKYDGTDACEAFNGNVTMKDWMGYQFDADAERCNGSKINIFGRVAEQLAIFCAVSLVSGGTATTSAELTAGTQTVTFDAATKASMLAECGISPDMEDGTAISLVTSHPTGAYDTTLAFDMNNDGTADMELFVTYTATTVKIASNETNENGSSRTLVDISGTVTKAEYLSRNNDDGVYIHRLHHDSAADLARVMSQESGTSLDFKRYTVTGKPTSTTDLDVAVAIDLNDSSNPSYSSDFDRHACVNKNTGDISSDGPEIPDRAFTCAPVTGVEVDAATAFGDVSLAVAASPTWNALTVSTDLSWSTIDNMLTGSL